MDENLEILANELKSDINYYKTLSNKDDIIKKSIENDSLSLIQKIASQIEKLKQELKVRMDFIQQQLYSNDARIFENEEKFKKNIYERRKLSI